MILKIINWPDGALVFVTFLVLVATIALAIFVFYRFRRDYRNYRDEMTLLIEGALTKNEIIFSVNSYISKIPKDMSFSVMLLSFDKFDDVVSIFGEKEAQKILERFVANIDKALPQKVQIGRYSKDEFLVVTRSDYTRVETMRLAERIKEAASMPIKVMGGTETNHRVSIGIAYYPYHGRNFKQIFNSLNLALYIAKREGGDNIVLYSDEMSVKESENVRFYGEIKEAIAAKQFMLYYQPIVNIADKKIYGAEALLRWQHPEYGVLSPNKFIHIIEQSGDINWVGNWGVECLIKEYLTLRKMFPNKNFQLSMNLSPKQLANENLIMNFQNLIKKYRMLAKNLTLEIIEFAIFEKHEVVKDNLNKLKELGFQIAVDGFAMDHTILEKIGSLPIDIIKLDRDFLQEDEETSFLKTRYAEMLIEFAEKNNKKIICEGIENFEMLKKAEKYKINLLQGYYLSKPISDDEFHKYLNNEKEMEKRIESDSQLEEVPKAVEKKIEEPDHAEKQVEEPAPLEEKVEELGDTEKQDEEGTQAPEAPVEKAVVPKAPKPVAKKADQSEKKTAEAPKKPKSTVKKADQPENKVAGAPKTPKSTVKPESNPAKPQPKTVKKPIEKVKTEDK